MQKQQWRAKKLRWPVAPQRAVIITLRRFRTNKASRSRQFRQIVVRLYASRVKEVAIRYDKQPRRTRAQAPSRRQSLAPYLFITAGVAGIAYFGWQINRVDTLEPVTSISLPAPATAAAEAPTQKGLPRSEPTRVRAPSVGINAPVKDVGQKPDKTMQVPAEPDVTGWYKHAPTPGEIGPSIIVGHVDSPKGPAVFWRLRELKPGDIVEIDRADGRTVKFKVTALKQFEQDNFPTKEVYGNIDHAGLRLITCGGVYNRQTRSYTHNTVVYASIVK